MTASLISEPLDQVNEDAEIISCAFLYCSLVCLAKKKNKTNKKAKKARKATKKSKTKNLKN